MTEFAGGKDELARVYWDDEDRLTLIQEVPVPGVDLYRRVVIRLEGKHARMVVDCMESLLRNRGF